MYDKFKCTGPAGKYYYFAGKLPHGVSGGAVTLAVTCSVSLELRMYGEGNISTVKSPNMR